MRIGEEKTAMDTFDRIFILGRPASGKSEFLDFMSKISDEERATRYHIGRMAVVDDFVWLWEQCSEDDLWEKVNGTRPHGSIPDPCGYINTPEQFNFLMAKFDQEISRRYLDDAAFFKEHTLFIEFARGGMTPYEKALSYLSPAIYERAAILYVEVAAAESRRRNDARYKEKLKSSILAHKTPDRVMEIYYREDDWSELTGSARFGSIKLQGVNVPFFTMNNEPESKDPVVLGPRYKEALDKLWTLRRSI
jgi:hypothetical protein